MAEAQSYPCSCSRAGQQTSCFKTISARYTDLSRATGLRQILEAVGGPAKSRSCGGSLPIPNDVDRLIRTCSTIELVESDRRGCAISDTRFFVKANRQAGSGHRVIKVGSTMNRHRSTVRARASWPICAVVQLSLRKTWRHPPTCGHATTRDWTDSMEENARPRTTSGELRTTHRRAVGGRAGRAFGCSPDASPSLPGEVLRSRPGRCCRGRRSNDGNGRARGRPASGWIATGRAASHLRRITTGPRRDPP